VDLEGGDVVFEVCGGVFVLFVVVFFGGDIFG